MAPRQKFHERPNTITVSNATIFNRISRDVCTLIAPYLDARDLKSLCLASTGTNVCFYNALKLREDAHVILQELMNGTLEGVRALLEEARQEYGDDVWKLLVMPTYGRELHNGRCWEAETAVRAAARSGDLYHYLGEANDVNPIHSEIASTYLLNLLYAYIPQEYRCLANAQLWDLQVIGEVMSAFRELIDEYNDYENRFDNRNWDERNAAWQKGCGGRHKLLPWYGLRIMCDEIDYDPMPDFNNLRAPTANPMLSDGVNKVMLSSCISSLGSTFGIYRGVGVAISMAGQVDGRAGGSEAIQFSRSVVSRYVEVKCMQLEAFIAWQKWQDEKYREEQNQKNSLQLIRR